MSGAGESERVEKGEAVELRSAGGVVVKGKGDGLRVAVMRSRYGTWVLPKGGVEDGEEGEAAAAREIWEEMGLKGLAGRGELGCTEHEFERDGRWCRKRVEWFLFEAGADAEVRADPVEGALDGGWFTVEQALSLLSHVDQRRVLRRGVAVFRAEV